MTRWITTALGDASLNEASITVGRSLLADICNSTRPTLGNNFNFIAHSLELAAFGLLDETDRRADLRSAAEQAFESLRALSPDASDQFSSQLTSCIRHAMASSQTGPQMSRGF